MGQSAFYAYAYLFNASLLLIANKLFKPKIDDTKINDFTPTTLASQGAFVPLLVGRRRLGPVFAWAGNRGSYTPVTTVRTKGSKKKKQAAGPPVYSEAGWHLLCVGPASALNKIYQDGRVIYDTPINPSTTPSGSTLSTSDGTGDTFQIYWGEEAQPINTFLGDAGRVGISSRWPFLCYVVWTRKTLGQAPRWPLLEYDVECGGGSSANYSAFESENASTGGASSWAGASTHHVDETINVTITQPDYYFISDKFDAGGFGGVLPANSSRFLYLRRWTGGEPATSNPTWTNVEVTFDGDTIFSDAGPLTANSPAPAGWDYATYSTTHAFLYRQGFVYGPVWLEAGTYALRLQADLSGLSAGDSWATQLDARVWRGSGFGALYQILFSEAPHGLGLDTADFDVASLLHVSSEIEDEGILQSAIASDGEEALAILAGLMQDAGVFLYRDPSTGLLTFARIRQGTAQVVPAAMVVGRVPEIDVVHEDRAATRLIFTFEDEDRAFRETAITVDEDGIADRLSHHRARKVPLPTIVDEDSAAIVSERRAQEELAGAAAVRITLNRGARTLYPGALLEVPGIDEVLRVLEVRPIANSGEVEITLVPDYYGSQPSTYSAPAGGGTGGGHTSGGTAVAADEVATFLEVPGHLLGAGDPPHIVVPRVRAHDQITRADLHLSIDDTTYQLVDAEFDIQTGGELLEAIAADDPYEIDEGPTLELLGPPDDDTVDDLSSDEANWRLGRQVVAIGGELFFLKKLTAISGTTYRLDGLIRARYDTERAAHAIGASVFIFRFDEINAITDPLLAPGVSLYVKAQPYAATGLSLASVTAINKTLYGKGVVPPRPVGLRVTAPALGVAGYTTGEDVTFRWASRLADPPITGAGMQPAGVAVGAGVVGATTGFEIRVYDATDTLVRTETRSIPEWTYTNAQLQADLGGETDFTVEVVEFSVGSGVYSDAIELEVTAL